MELGSGGGVRLGASLSETYRIFGLNLPTKGHKQPGNPAFTSADVDTIRDWVERGGSLLLIADHAPHGGAAAPLAAVFDGDVMAIVVAMQIPGNDNRQFALDVLHWLSRVL